MAIQTFIETLVVKICPVCAIRYGVPQDFDQLNDERSRSWYCPAGHSLCYTTSELEKARRRARAAEEEAQRERTSREFWIDEHERQRRKAAAAKGQTTKLRKRIAKGVCPCCNRSFTNVAEHMRNQHPEFAEAHPDA